MQAILEGKIALVTGASGTIGSATAKLLASMGAVVFLHYHSNVEQAEAVLQDIEQLRRKAYLLSADLTEKTQVKEMFSDIKEKEGKLDILINNAGISEKAYIKFMSEAAWDRVIDTNLKSAYLCSKYAMQLLCKSEEGCIVNVASFSVVKALVGETAYSASKAGMIALTKTMAKEAGGLRVRVNAVAPGPVRSKKQMEEAKEKELRKLIPLKRIAEPEDVANAIVLFCMPMSSYLTGQVMVVDGGLSL